jgi:hypothetical protein
VSCSEVKREVSQSERLPAIAKAGCTRWQQQVIVTISASRTRPCDSRLSIASVSRRSPGADKVGQTVAITTSGRLAASAPVAFTCNEVSAGNAGCPSRLRWRRLARLRGRG